MTIPDDLSAPRKAVIMPVAKTLADVIAAAEADATLSSTRRRDLPSSVRRVCALLSLDPATTPASMRLIPDLLDGFSWTQAGIAKKTFQTIRSNIQFAIRRYALLIVPARGQGLSADWKTLLEQISADQLRYRLSRFIGYCSMLGIPPDDVGEEVFEQYREWLIEGTLLKNPGRQYHNTVLAWNAASETVPDWPPRSIEQRNVLSRLGRYPHAAPP